MTAPGRPPAEPAVELTAAWRFIGRVERIMLDTTISDEQALNLISHELGDLDYEGLFVVDDADYATVYGWADS